MPLVAYKDLPTFDRLKNEGREILSVERALSQEIRELHIGLLNIMQDGALEPTERQFFRLIGSSNKIAQFYIHPFTLPSIEWGDKAKAHIDQYYEPLEQIKKDGLDALIITGRNIADPDLSKAPFWDELCDVFDWAYENVTSTLTACLATHAVMDARYGQKRARLQDPPWGIYKHRVLNRDHPLVRDMNTLLDVPHSRNNTISREQFEQADMIPLIESTDGGVHVATSSDGLRLVCFQGHPEYDTISLLKEYRREVERHLKGEREDYPEFPTAYFSEEVQEILTDYKAAVSSNPNAPFPEDKVTPLLDNTWRDSAATIIGNWIGQVYQLTNMDRRKAFMDGIDPKKPMNFNI